MNDLLWFLAAFVRSPLTTGAIAPSSARLAEAMVAGAGVARAATVVELGPGTGVFTEAIARQLAPGATFLALELNARFAERLGRRGLPRVTVVNDSADRIAFHLAARGRSHADAIVSGLPWASFPQEARERIMTAVMGVLRPGGRFATFAYAHAAGMPTARSFRRQLERHFTRVERTRTVWRNVPPAFVYCCER